MSVRQNILTPIKRVFFTRSYSSDLEDDGSQSDLGFFLIKALLVLDAID